jgi:hypothetical protein
MITRTIDEIRDKVSKIWPAAEDVGVKTRDDGAVLIKVSSMYHAPGMSFSMLSDLSEFMGTKKIDDEDHFSWSGCETCDYGSKYGFTLVVGP